MDKPSHPQEYAMWIEEKRAVIDKLYEEINKAERWFHKFTKMKLYQYRWRESAAGRIRKTNSADMKIQILEGYLNYLKN